MTDRSTIYAILAGAKARIADPANWCQEWHFYMKDGTPMLWSNLFEEEDGHALWPTNEQKVAAFAKVARCCLDGAILLQTGSETSQAYIDTDDILRTESKKLGFDSHVNANDMPVNGHANAMAILDASIAYAAQP